MPQTSFPVDLRNPAQVFACLGIWEACQILFGQAEGSFDWSDPLKVRFSLDTPTPGDPLRALLEFLAEARVVALRPPLMDKSEEEGDSAETELIESVTTFPAPHGNPMALPVLLRHGHREVVLSHWADATRADSFKLYAGNRSAYGIARAMLEGVRKSPKKGQLQGDILRKGIQQLWTELQDELLSDPLSVSTPLGGSFNFDARRAWTAIDAGFSPNQQKTPVTASPLVELLAAWGLEYTRPLELSVRKYRYAVWGVPLPLSLARACLAASLPHLTQRFFEFELALSGKDKVVNYAEERHPS